MTRTTTPADLGKRGRAFWTSTTKTYVLTESELELLREVCRLMDECEDLRQAVATDGTTVLGSTGQPRVHPAVGELRSHRLALGRLLSQLALPDEDDDALATPLQARGRAAASKRWAGTQEGRVMARRKLSAAAPVVAGSGVLADDALRAFRSDVYGTRTPETVKSWLRDRATWRDRNPGAALPLMGSLDLASLMSYYARGEIGEDLYRAERTAPVDRSTGRR